MTLLNVPPSVWDGVAALGFDDVYLMGVWQRSAIGREIARLDAGLRAEYDLALPGWADQDVAGSPYSISAYEPDERMGGWAGLDAARAAIHARGMRLIIDFVPNHTGFDHPWVTAHPDWFVLGTDADAAAAPGDFRESGGSIVACGRDPYYAPWRDVAQVNVFNPAARAALTDVLREISGHADGVRCDMAMLVVNQVFDGTWRHLLRERWPVLGDEFWPGAIAAVPSLTYLAEVYWDYEWTLQQQGFHFTYDKRLLDRLHGSPAREVREHLLADASFSARLARFLENHDEPRSARHLHHRLQASATMVATLPGMRFFFDGQMEGARVRTPVQLGRWAEEAAVPEVRDMYARLLRAAGGELFHKGEWRLLYVEDAGDRSHEDLIAWQWRFEDELAVSVVNLGAGSAQGHVGLHHLPAGDAWHFEDQLTDRRYRWTREAITAGGLYVRLDAGAAHLLIAR